MNSPIWNPSIIRWVARAKDTGSEVVEAVTDAGPGFIKFLGNKEGPHVLAAEYVGTRLASSLGLPILDWHVFHYDGTPEIRLFSGKVALPGSAWSTRKVEGAPWVSASADDLQTLVNPADVVKLVVLDQWTLNCDRFRPAPRHRQNPHNVFFTRENTPPGKLRLLAIDHTHILTCGGEWTPSLNRLERIRDETAYGLFPGFRDFLRRREDAIAAVAALEAVDDAQIYRIVNEIPQDWEVDAAVRQALIDFLAQRRNWLVGRFVSSLFPQDEFPF
jgi:hypothetical protein